MKALKLLLLLIPLLVISCGNDDDPEIFSSGFWEDSYLQYHVKNKVKTIKEWDEGSTSYDYLEFNNKGCIIKELSYNSSGNHLGNAYTYDGNGRLIKVEYHNRSGAITEVANFGYSGSHNIYIPTNIYSMGNLRLQRGVTSAFYQVEDDDPMTVNFESNNNNQLVFNATAGIMENEFNSKNLKAIVDYNESYPTHITFQNPANEKAEVFIQFDSNGLPVEVKYHPIEGNIRTTKFTTIQGYLLITTEGSTVYEYNEHGHLIKEKSGSWETIYSYEYDQHKNWTKRTEKEAGSDDEITLREYTYW